MKGNILCPSTESQRDRVGDMNTEAIPQGEGRYSQDWFALLRSLVLGIRAPYSPYGFGQIYPVITDVD